MKLKNSIPSNSVKLIELYNKIDSGFLITGPDYQRKLVWKKQHKFAFIETILMNFPFPEIYIASAIMDVKNFQSIEVVVDGQQRLTTIVDYIKGRGDFTNQKSIVAFDELTIEEKKEFLNYSISVKDLKDIGEDNIIEVFKRINSTDYSLNSNEILNAQYGGGEFAIFSKLLADNNYQPTVKETAILIKKETREIITNFIEQHSIFTDNDIKRMFDSQYFMLIASTILEGKYFGRNSRINYYLEKYNYEFYNYELILDKIINSIQIINLLNFSNGSYWFNKANLFTLIIELNNSIISDLNLGKLESRLLDLENKVDLYFTGDEDEISTLTNDETKYFEVARQGSHELASREHRAKVIKEIISSSLTNTNKDIPISNNILGDNLELLKLKGIDFSILTPTSTGLIKGILDATSIVRDFLKRNDLHDYSIQETGPSKKIKLKGQFILANFSNKKTEVSLYRSNGRGDYRIWFSDLKDYADAKDDLCLIIKDDILTILNLSKHKYSEYL